ncbi:MAG: 4-hydroxy-3-methylbut-2-enyl diphosphate reductase [Candidatus Omnitrophica bacterium]|jgi:4-hydroxy-3-methylbut-2-enyl diphosphate reductase|nr:4-hydroxy-3-methylbut-2-enyl diphosphate reductase [Candidatus Omnitrophota bacterium]
MKISVAKSAGFCFGVKRAIDLALKATSTSRGVVMLGDIVHNEYVVKQLEKAGIKKMNKLCKEKNKTLLIRAHGAPLSIYKKAKKLNYKIIDATCPMVKEIHRIAQNMEKENYEIIIIGDKDHDEVLGVIGHLKKGAIVIDKVKNIPFKRIKKIKKAGIVIQSTQNIEKALEIVKVIRKYINNVRFVNTICGPTRQKQSEIKSLPQKNNVMIIIGSKNSANTKRLYEISKYFNKNTYWVKSAKDLRKLWFKKVKTVGITAGASTPDYITEEIVKSIKELN